MPEAAAILGFTVKKKQEKAISAFAQGNDVFVALPTGFGKSLSCILLLLTTFEVYSFSSESSVKDVNETPGRMISL